MDTIDEILAFDPVKSSSEQDETDAILQFDPAKQPEPEEPEDQEEEYSTWREALTEGMGNVPSSAWKYAQDIATPILHPKQTASALWGLTKGVAQKTTPGVQDEEKYVDAMVDFYKGRYGSTAGFKKAIAEDPVGVLADVASVVTGAGMAAKGAGTLGKVKSLTAAGNVIEKVGMAMEPISLTRRIAASPLKLVPDSVPISQYESAVKFGTTMTAEERRAVTRTALAAKNQIMPTSKGIEKLRGMIDDYNVRINDLINQSANSGAAISVDRLYRGLDEIKDKFKRMSDEPKVWDNAFRQIRGQWDEALDLGAVRTPQEVQKIKTRIYKDLKTLYEQHKATPAKKELRKAIAKNAKESLEEIIPEIKHLNKKEGELLDLLDALESKANRITNRDLIGIGLPVKTGTLSGIGYMVGGPQGGAIGSAFGFALGIYDTPQVKAKMALVMNKLKEQGITVKPTHTLVKLGLYQLAKPEDFTEEEQ